MTQLQAPQSYDTITAQIGDVVITASRPEGGKPPSAADRLEAFLKWLSGKLVDPDYGVDAGGRPDNSLPGAGGRPDNSLPGEGGRPDNSLPEGGTPDNSLPGGGGRPDNSLPGGGSAGQLPSFIGDHAKAIAAIILKNTLCDPAQPK